MPVAHTQQKLTQITHPPPPPPVFPLPIGLTFLFDFLSHEMPDLSGVVRGRCFHRLHDRAVRETRVTINSQALPELRHDILSHFFDGLNYG